MSTTTTKVNVIVIGATGYLGANLAAGFQLPQYAPKVNLTLLVRKDTAEKAGPKKDALDAFVAKGAKLVYGDISSSTETELTAALKGQDVLVSAVGGAQLGEQLRLLPAAKSAGVKWFIPSEFGYDAVAVGASGALFPPVGCLPALEDAIKASGLDWTFVCNGIFSESVIGPFFGVDLTNHTITAPVSFDHAVTQTTPLTEVGLLTADMVVNNRGRNQVVKFGNGPYTYEEIASMIEQASGKKFTRIVKTRKEYEDAVAANTYDYIARFGLLLAETKGRGGAWPEAETYEVKYKIPRQSFQEFLKLKLGGK